MSDPEFVDKVRAAMRQVYKEDQSTRLHNLREESVDAMKLSAILFFASFVITWSVLHFGSPFTNPWWLDLVGMFALCATAASPLMFALYLVVYICTSSSKKD